MKLKLIDTKKLFDDVESFMFEPDEPVAWQPGQYMHYVFPHNKEDNRGHERWFTISSAPFENHLQITTRFAPEKGSSFKSALESLKVGSEIQADGPEGDFVINDTSKKYILIAGGIGITPYHSILAQLDHDKQPFNVELLWANRDNNFVFGDELSDIEQRNPNFHIHKFIGDKRIEETDLKPHLDDPNTIFYISGPEPMVEGYEETLQKMGAPKDRVKTDFFPGY